MPKSKTTKPIKAKEPYVVQYETKNDEYKYASFWDGREYEDRAERILLSKLVQAYPDKSPPVANRSHLSVGLALLSGPLDFLP